jgi:DNA excision repair protein ERCC-4
MIVVIDTRERLPYQFALPTRKGTLLVGDYSVVGLEDEVAIERKSADDLLHCLSRDRCRFEEELRRSQRLRYFALVIEGTLRDLVSGRYWSRMTPKNAVQSLLGLSVRYRLPIWFCENRDYAQKVTQNLLVQYARELELSAQQSAPNDAPDAHHLARVRADDFIQGIQ